jgi:hypothetical protein
MLIVYLSQCDESLPRCRVCSTRGLQCIYAALHVVNDPPAIPPVRLPLNRLVSLAVTDDTQSPVTSTPDALLWQYYLAHASKTITASSTDPAHTRMWEKSIPAIAFSSAVVAHAMLAFSAFCLCTSPSSSRTKSENRELLATAERHYSRSVRLLRLSLAAVEDLDADVVLACVIVLIPCGLALVCRERDEEGRVVSPLQDWLYHLRGWRPIGASIYGVSGQLDAASKLIAYPQPGIPEAGDLPERSLGGNGDGLWTSSMLWVRGLQGSWLGAMAQLRCAVSLQSRRGGYAAAAAADVTAYTAAITALEGVVDYIMAYPVTNLFRAVFIWPIQVPAEFIQLLADHDDLALAIYAHWLVVTMALDDLWWLKEFGSGQIERLAERAVSFDSSGFDLLAWPVEMLGEWRRIGREEWLD